MIKRTKNRDRVFALLAALSFASMSVCLALGYARADGGAIDELERNLAVGFAALFLFNMVMARRSGRG